MINNISVWWHVVGVAVIIALLVFVPDDHQSFDFVFTERINNSRLQRRHMFWFYVLPLGLPAHPVHDHRLRRLGPHLRGDARRVDGAARGVWQSIFYSAVIGWFVLLAITFAAHDPANVTDRRTATAPAPRSQIFSRALDTAGVQGRPDHLDDRPAVLRRSPA